MAQLQHQAKWAAQAALEASARIRELEAELAAQVLAPPRSSLRITSGSGARLSRAAAAIDVAPCWPLASVPTGSPGAEALVPGAPWAGAAARACQFCVCVCLRACQSVSLPAGLCGVMRLLQLRGIDCAADQPGGRCAQARSGEAAQQRAQRDREAAAAAQSVLAARLQARLHARLPAYTSADALACACQTQLPHEAPSEAVEVAPNAVVLLS